MSGFYTDSGSWIDTGFQDSDGSYRDAIGPNTENTEPPDDGTYGSLGRNREPGTTIDGVFWRRIGFAPQLQGPGIRNDPEYGWIVHPSMDAQVKAEQARRTNAGGGGISGLLDKGAGVFALGAGMLGAIGMHGGFSAATGFGAGTGLADAAALETGLAAYSGPGAGVSGASNMDFFGDYLGDIFGFEDALNAYSGPGSFPGGGSEVGMPDFFADDMEIQNYIQSTGGMTVGGPSSSITDFIKKAANSLTSPTSSAGEKSAANSLLRALGIDPSSILGSGLSTLASVGPSLGAINYATNLPEPDISKLNSAYSSIDPNALALPYDIQTGRGRESLNSSLTSRGVMGSSFGNQDMESYDTMRGLGRSSLLTSGATSQASIAKQILDAQQAAQKNKLDLYGRSLLALSGGLNPARSGAF